MSSHGTDRASPQRLGGQHHFSVNAEGHIIYGLGGIKGLGEGPIEDLLAAREEKPLLICLIFVVERIRKVNRKR